MTARASGAVAPAPESADNALVDTHTVKRPTATGREAGTVLVLGPSVALTEARTAGVRLFERRPPLHSVLLGRSRLELSGRLIDCGGAFAVPAGIRHRVLGMEGAVGAVAYLDARRYRFEDAARLAETWRGFVPGQDDLTEAFGDALRMPRRRVPPRLLRALDVLEGEGATVAAAAARVGLSAGRLTHLMTDSLSVPPLAFRSWFKLRRALQVVLFGHASLTHAAHAAGFADSAHLTRTTKALMGVRPAEMLPPIIHLSREG